MKRNQKQLSVFVMLSIFALTAVAVSMAAPAGPTSLSVIDSSRRTLPAVNRTDNALAGNVTELSISTIQITQGWQGYYGNVTGTIVLDDASNNTLYSWNFVKIAGEVYASRNHSIDWSSGNIVCADAGNVSIENSIIFPGSAADDSDNITNTFTQTTHPAFNVGSNSFSANQCTYSLSTYVDDAADAARTFNETLLYSKTTGGIIYTAILNDNGNGFKTGADSYDFQMLVGEDGHSNSATTTYYFYVELTA